MRKFLILVMMFIVGISFSQSKCLLMKEYAQMFKVHKEIYKGKPFIYETSEKINAKYTCADFVNNHTSFFQYLLDNFSNHSERKKKLQKIEDSTILQKNYINLLKRDTSFASLLQKLTRAINTNQKKDTISLDKLLDISVKFFQIYKIKDGNFYGKVCGGINGIRDTEKTRHPFVEAFSFSCIWNHYKSKEPNMYNEFVEGIKELYKLELGLKEKEKLLRAQGAMYMYMRNNDMLKSILIKEYKKQENYLPFVLKI